MKKVFLSIVFVVTIIISMSVSVYASEQEVKVNVDGITVLFDVPPQIINGRTMVPIRAIFEALGANVEWDNSTSTANASIGDYNVSLTLNQDYIVADSEKIQMDTQAIMINNRILAPARFVAESFLCEVLWEEASQTVHIFTPYNLNEFYPYSDLPSLQAQIGIFPIDVGADFDVDENGRDIFSFTYSLPIDVAQEGLKEGGIFINYVDYLSNHGWVYNNEKSSFGNKEIILYFSKDNNIAIISFLKSEEASDNNALVCVVYDVNPSYITNSPSETQPQNTISKQEILELAESVNLGIEDLTTALEFFNKELTTSNIDQKKSYYMSGTVFIDMALLDFERAYKISSKYSETNDATKYLEIIIKNLKSIPEDYSNNIAGNLGAAVYALQDLTKAVKSVAFN